jgi:hypothetical protein
MTVSTLQGETFTRTLEKTIVLDSTRQAKLGFVPDLLHTHSERVTSQIDHIVGIQ